MRYVVGAIFIVVGIGQFLLRDRIARANAASNKVMWNGALSGPKSIAASKVSSGIVGLACVIFGSLLLAGVFHMA